MRWNIIQQITSKNKKTRTKEIVKKILKNRELISKNQIDRFLSTKDPLSISLKEVDIDSKQVSIAITRIKEAIENKEEIIVFGDYDADGITATAILWETLHELGARVLPFIPHREKHGYGLSTKAIDSLLEDKDPKLIITVDNGIVAHEAVDYIKQKNIDCIITDHHVSSDSLPKADAIIHTTKLAGAGVSWIFSREIIKKLNKEEIETSKNTLDLATIGTVADQVPLIENNRNIVKAGLIFLKNTKRPGLLALFKQSDFDPKVLSAYHINYIIGPRINAMGRLAHGLDSLRILCTKNNTQAKNLADLLSDTNKERQDITFELLQLAKEVVGEVEGKLIIVDHSDFHEGVIGLVAGKLAETHYRPSIVIGKGKKTSKASARSVKGINIIELIRKAEDLLINAGGHPMAAGFTIETGKISEFKKVLLEIARKEIDEELLTPLISIDCQINIEDISWELFESLKGLEPHGMGNKKPVFCIKNVKVLEKMTIGRDKNHLKIILPSEVKKQTSIEALWFGHGQDSDNIKDEVNIAFTVDENTWNGRSKLQLFIKDIQ
ncbi:single-stranded-DNA-specific exonuclease RecJ [Patescibacteria group bacterium]